MTVTLALETASTRYGVAVCDEDSVLFHHSQLRTDPAFPGLVAFVEAAVAAAGVRFADLTRVAVDVGPGNLGSVRAGVAYANAFAYARDLPVASVDALRVLATGAARLGAGPVLCVRHAGAGDVFAGWFPVGGPAGSLFGRPADVVPALVGAAQHVTVAGAMRRDALAALLPAAAVVDSGVEYPDVLDLCAALSDSAVEADYSTPVTRLVG